MGYSSLRADGAGNNRIREGVGEHLVGRGVHGPYVSWNPLAGDEIVGSGGVRKLRFGMAGRGKSGGARIIYFYYNESAPLYLLTCFAKSARANLSDAEVRTFAKITAGIKAAYRKVRHE